MAKPSRWTGEKRYQVVKEALSQKEPMGQIAREGALFTDYYTQQFCTAGRAAFILGQTPVRTDLLRATAAPGSNGRLDRVATASQLGTEEKISEGSGGRLQ